MLSSHDIVCCVPAAAVRTVLPVAVFLLASAVRAHHTALLATKTSASALCRCGRRHLPGARRTSRWPCHEDRGGLANTHCGLKAELPISTTNLPADDSALCQSCGACCAYSKEWPRFSTEPDADLDRIPLALIDDTLGRMRCNGDRCMALVGEVGVATACSIYAVRPEVCRTCLPGDDACRMARLRHGLSPIERR